jgi:hypothetical protein
MTPIRFTRVNLLTPLVSGEVWLAVVVVGTCEEGRSVEVTTCKCRSGSSSVTTVDMVSLNFFFVAAEAQRGTRVKRLTRTLRTR